MRHPAQSVGPDPINTDVSFMRDGTVFLTRSKPGPWRKLPASHQGLPALQVLRPALPHHLPSPPPPPVLPTAQPQLSEAPATSSCISQTAWGSKTRPDFGSDQSLDPGSASFPETLEKLHKLWFLLQHNEGDACLPEQLGGEVMYQGLAASFIFSWLTPNKWSLLLLLLLERR